ncbi:hypothetical protein BASA83_006155 [Batrachochytrium salamandrivorans]|nr:hypothetical protein BASA83_006155 [Batrachochytrium salamandrivorans]
MTHEQFSLGLARIFNKMRDKHTAFYKAGPYGCFSVTTGLHFQFVDDSLGSPTPPKVRVIMITDNPGILGLIGNVLSTVAIGDELLTVNGLSFKEFKDTKIDDLAWTIWENGGRNMGVISIESFTPVLKDTKEDTTFLVLIETIRNLLVNQLKNTDAILLDIRGNSGGLISVADGIIQLFKSDVTASTFRYLKNDATKSLFYKD